MTITDDSKRIGWKLKDLAAATGMSVSHWRREIRLGRLPYVRFDLVVMILPADLERYFAERRRETRHQETLTSAA